MIKNTKWVFVKKGTCSRTLFYVLNREFDNPHEQHEQSIDQMAGGILQQGHQCGQVWGAAMGAGTEVYRRHRGHPKAVAMAIRSSQALVESFKNRARSVDCFDIMETDWTKKGNIPKMLVTGKFLTCFRLADKWAPEAFETLNQSLNEAIDDLPAETISCASEVVKSMGGSDEEAIMAAGFAGGIGLSGGGCGALAAAIWMKSLQRIRNGEKTDFPDKNLNEFLKKFYEHTDFEIRCDQICGRKFNTMEDHSDYIRGGGCKELLDHIS